MRLKNHYTKGLVEVGCDEAGRGCYAGPVYAAAVILDPKKEVRFKVTRPSLYGDRYKLFVIDKNTFEEEYNLEDYGINLVKQNNKIIVDNLKWNGQAKKSGFEMGDYISEFKIENRDRPDKDWIYLFALILLGLFGFSNYKRDKN